MKPVRVTDIEDSHYGGWAGIMDPSNITDVLVMAGAGIFGASAPMNPGDWLVVMDDGRIFFGSKEVISGHVVFNMPLTAPGTWTGPS